MLKSDQNGIEIKNTLEVDNMEWKLKSDQNGIEMDAFPGCIPRVHSLKSDQNGIEIEGYYDLGTPILFCVKIRPKWD